MPLLNHSRLAVLALLLTSTSASAQETIEIAIQEPQKISVRIIDIEPQAGQIEISVFNSADNFMKEPILQTKIPVEGESVETAFLDPPEGDYAIVAVHDANDNGELDRGFLGIGGEGYGFSNNVHPWFGWPSFEDASFKVETSGADIEISVK